MASRRAVIAARRRRERREAQERAWREWVCGGPLVEHDKPVMTSGDDAQGYDEFWRDMQRRSRRMTVESELLVVAFARGCCVRRAEEIRMLQETLELLESAGRAFSVPTGGTTNPALGGIRDIVQKNHTAPGRTVSDALPNIPRL